MLCSWARAFAYSSSAHRAKVLAIWLRWYNRRRPHASLGRLPPAFRTSVISTAGIHPFHDAGAAGRLDDLLEILHQLEEAVPEATPTSMLSAAVRVLLGSPPPPQIAQLVVEARASSADLPAAAKEESDA